MKGALSGVRVLDFSTLLPGPMATLFLADAGAEVIKVENPGRGDEMRSYFPRWSEDSTNFHLLNRGKSSIALDLKSAEGQARLLPLLETADILIEQYRPGVMERLGLSYKAVRKFNPDIIYCSITGYGQTGPKHLTAGHDLNYQGDTGLVALSLGTAETPVVPPALIADIAGGTYPALLNILLALRRRDQTGEGACLDIAMADNLFPFMYWAQGEGQVAGEWPKSGASLVTGGSPRYRLYPAADGRMVAVAALEEKFWAAFCNAINLPQALRDDAVDPLATREGIAAILKSRPSTHWDGLLRAADCCCSIVRTLSEAMNDPHFVARGVFAARIANDRGEDMPALPTPIAPAFKSQPNAIPQAPTLGAHNAQFVKTELS